MLFKQDLMLSEVSLSKHFDTIDSRAELNFLRMIEKIKHESQRADIVPISKLEEAKLIVTQILEHKNRQIVAEKRKGKTFLDFQYSKHSPYSDYIKKTKGGSSLTDVLKFL